MTTINSLDDFLQALDNNPAWREAVRTRILGEDLLQLPKQFSALVEQTASIATGLNSLVQRFDSFVAEQHAFNAEQHAFNAEQHAFNANADARMNRIESDISATKGGHVRTLLDNLMPDMIEELGFETARAIRRGELVRIARSITNATQDELRSFRRADMVLHATNAQGNFYLAIEASFTANLNDTGRAQRNSGFLTQATGTPAIPVIASVRNTHEATELIESGTVRWYQIEERDTQPE